MAFDIKTAKPVGSGFDINTAKPVSQAEQSKYRKLFNFLPIPVPRVLDKPMQMAESGINQLAGMIPEPPAPTGNVPLDLALGAPSILTKAGIKATGKVASGFLSPESAATYGATKVLGGLAPLANTFGRGAGSQLESLSGSQPGALRAAFNDAATMFRSGKSAAGAGYKAARAAEELPKELQGLYKPEEILDTGKKLLEEGKLNPRSALMVRKAIDKLLGKKTIIADELYELKPKFDAIAKSSENISEADKAYKQGLYAESLRKFLPQNVGKTTSAFKTGIMTALGNMGLPGKIAMTALSPAAMGAASTGAGLISRYGGAALLTNPAAAVSAQQLGRSAQQLGGVLAKALWQRKQQRENNAQ